MTTRLADLHIHTTYSDGTFTPEEAVRHARDIGLSCIAICDHDSVKGLREALGAGEAFGVEVIPAVEIGAEVIKDKEAHLLGYFIDYQDRNLLEALGNIREDRKKRLYKMAALLNKHGFNIDADDILKFCGDVSISRLHIARYMKAKGLISTLKEAFIKYIGDNGPCYVSGFRYQVKDAVNIIKNAKGIAVIAHPALDGISQFLPKLTEDGIDGLEAFHSDHKKSASKALIEYAKKENLLITGGSDCHGKAKGEMLMGTVKLPYSYVEDLKNARIN